MSDIVLILPHYLHYSETLHFLQDSDKYTIVLRSQNLVYKA